MGKKNNSQDFIQHKFCTHANCRVTISSTLSFPAEIIPDSPPRIMARNCSHYLDCSLQDKSACTFKISNINRERLIYNM